MLHPITGIPLYLNTRRIPYVLKPELLQELSQNAIAATGRASGSSETRVSDIEAQADQPSTDTVSTDQVKREELESTQEAPSTDVSSTDEGKVMDADNPTETKTIINTSAAEQEDISEPPVLNISFVSLLDFPLHFWYCYIIHQ